MAEACPYISELAAAISYDDASVVVQGCDDQFEFEFALDLMLDGLERMQRDETSASLPRNLYVHDENRRLERGLRWLSGPKGRAPGWCESRF
jgi:hypothetical protein